MEERKLILGSLFDGSGTFPLGGLMAGIQPVWSSDIEPFPIRVTTKRLPFVKHYGDIHDMDGGKIEPVLRRLGLILHHGHHGVCLGVPADGCR